MCENPKDLDQLGQENTKKETNKYPCVETWGRVQIHLVWTVHDETNTPINEVYWLIPTILTNGGICLGSNNLHEQRNCSSKNKQVYCMISKN